jgi:hypothetical protein
MQLVGGMAEPAYPAQSRSKLGIFDDEWWAGQDPLQRGSLSQNPALQQWFNARFVEQVALLCQRSLEDCYREIAATQDQRTPFYFAESTFPTTCLEYSGSSTPSAARSSWSVIRATCCARYERLMLSAAL